jgi:hypothetical protein
MLGPPGGYAWLAVDPCSDFVGQNLYQDSPGRASRADLAELAFYLSVGIQNVQIQSAGSQ